MTTFLQLLASGLALGVVYALVALGFVVIYRASQVFNFAQGEFVTIGAFVAATLASAGAPWIVALGGAVLVTGVVGALIQYSILSRLVGRPIYVSIILTIVIGYVLRTIVLLIWGPNPMGMPTPWETTGSVEVAGASLLYNSLASVVAGVLALVSFYLLMNRTRMGLGMRATSVDQESALALGIPVPWILGATWFLAGACAAVAGVFLGMFPRSVSADHGYVALQAFPAVIVGGLESAVGAVVAGLALGVVEVMSQGYVNPYLGQFGQNFHVVFPYLVMILFLIVRPYGLFGQAVIKRI